MRLGVELASLHRPGGVSDRRVAQGLAHGLRHSRLARSHQIVVAVDHHAPSTVLDDDIPAEVVRFRGGPRYWCNEGPLQSAYRAAGVDAGLFHHIAPWRRSVPSATLIHDVIPLTHPDTSGVLERQYLRLNRITTRRSGRLLTVSEFSKAEIVRAGYGPPSAVEVLRWGDDLPTPTPQQPSAWQPEGAFALVVGRVSARKRPLLALRGLQLADIGLEPVFVGPVEDSRLADEVRRQGGRLLGRVSEAELEWLYRHAELNIVTSAVEGFGLPVAEGLRRGCTTVATDIPPFAELGAGQPGCVLFRPDDPDDLARAITEAGRTPVPTDAYRAHRWSDCVDSLLAALLSVADHAPAPRPVGPPMAPDGAGR